MQIICHKLNVKIVPLYIIVQEVVSVNRLMKQEKFEEKRIGIVL